MAPTTLISSNQTGNEKEYKILHQEEKTHLIRRLIGSWKNLAASNPTVERPEYIFPSQEIAQNQIEELMYPVTGQDIDIIKEDLQSLKKLSSILREKIDEREDKIEIWKCLQDFNIEANFDILDTELSKNTEKRVNAILTRGTPFFDDSIFHPKELAELQRKDEKLKVIIDQIEKKPDNIYFRKEQKYPKKLINGTTFALVNRVLVADCTSKELTQFKYVLPDSLIYVITYKKHNLAHLGVQNTLQLVQEHYYWSKITSNISMLETAKQVCQSCLICQFFTRRAKYNNPTLPLLHMSLTSKCNEGWVVDVWNSGANSGKNRHLILGVCIKCRYTKAKVLHTVDSKTVSQFFLECMEICLPKYFLTDNASYFVSDETKKFFQSLNTGLRNWNEENKEDAISKETEEDIDETNIQEVLVPTQVSEKDIFSCITKLPTPMNGSCLFMSILSSQKQRVLDFNTMRTEAKKIRENTMDTATTILAIDKIRAEFIDPNIKDVDDIIASEIAEFRKSESKWTTKNRSVSVIEDLLPNFASAAISSTILVIRPDGSVSKTNGFAEKLNLKPKNEPILLLLGKDHFSGIKIKPGYEKLAKLLVIRMKDEMFLHQDIVNDIIRNITTNNPNKQFDHGSYDVDQINHKTSSAVYPQGHSMVERALGSVAAIITRLIEKRPEDWEIYIGRTILMMNMKIHKSIGVSPAALHHRRLQKEITPDLMGILEKANDPFPDVLKETTNELRIAQELFA